MSKTVSNFETLTIVLSDLGADWNPSQPLIKLQALREKLAVARLALAEVDRAEAERALAVNRRQNEFRDFAKFLVRVKRSVTTEIDDPEFENELSMIVRKARGQSVEAAAAQAPARAPATGPMTSQPAAEPEPTRPRSYRGHDDRIELISDFVALLETRSDYAPNFPELTVEGIRAKRDSMIAAHTAAKSAESARNSALAARRERLLDEKTGLRNISRMVKRHFAVAFGTDNNNFRRLSSLRF